MTITLSPDVESFVTTQVDAGTYSNADAVLRDAIAALAARQEHDRKLADLRANIAMSDADIEAGRFSTRTAHELLAGIRARKAS